LLVGHVLASHAPKLGHGRLIRIIDASSVPKASVGKPGSTTGSGGSTAPLICRPNASASSC